MCVTVGEPELVAQATRDAPRSAGGAAKRLRAHAAAAAWRDVRAHETVLDYMASLQDERMNFASTKRTEPLQSETNEEHQRRVYAAKFPDVRAVRRTLQAFEDARSLHVTNEQKAAMHAHRPIPHATDRLPEQADPTGDFEKVRCAKCERGCACALVCRLFVFNAHVAIHSH